MLFQIFCSVQYRTSDHIPLEKSPDHIVIASTALIRVREIKTLISYTPSSHNSIITIIISYWSYHEKKTVWYPIIPLQGSNLKKAKCNEQQVANELNRQLDQEQNMLSLLVI
ncbi:hypothetical protein ERL59_08510 [Chengkuizengella sp. YPA3-1-1]|uniref:Uncharacterized protein n=1 Tax=Chengkuizengella marina TaxID=2507566 RepID=A0A6N9PZS0_9BACL|nr:hypothetical protein [Chengkuizengella marina]